MRVMPCSLTCLKLNKSPFPTFVDQGQEYGEILKVRKKGRDKSIDWFLNKFISLKSPSKQFESGNKNENDMSELYYPSQGYQRQVQEVEDRLLNEEGFDDNILNTETTMKERPNVHPHCLTGAKGFETTFSYGETFDFKRSDRLEDYLVTEKKNKPNHHLNS